MASRKENLAEQIYKAKNELRELKGQERHNYDRGEIEMYARKSREYELHHELVGLIAKIEEEKEAARIKERRDAFYATEEGMKYKAKVEEDINTANEVRKDMRAQHIAWLEKFAAKEIGEEWAVKNVSESYCVFGIKNGERFVFGSDIDVHYDSYYLGNSPRFDVNIGTMGSFNPFERGYDSRADVYIGLGKLLANVFALNDLRAKMATYSKACDDMRERLEELRKMLNNPEISIM